MIVLLISLHEQGGDFLFLLLSGAISLFLCFWCIPETTDLMINSAAGLAGKYLGREQRTLAINSSTNNPELFSMLIAFGLGRIGGLANPLGSNFANIYLMFLFAPLVVIFKWSIAGKSGKIDRFLSLLVRERALCLWHVLMSLVMFCFATFAYWCMTGVNQFSPLAENTSLRPGYFLVLGGLGCLAGIFIFVWFENRLKARRRELFVEIDDADHVASWSGFLLGTVGLMTACYVLNSFFLVWSELYSSSLKELFGAAIFAGLHYFVGALITSLPEMTVAMGNYERLDTADLNTAMASASQSNMTNLAIAALGSLGVGIFLLLGFHSQL